MAKELDGRFPQLRTSLTELLQFPGLLGGRGNDAQALQAAALALLDLTDRIRELILEKRPISEVKKAAREEGMRFLRESAVDRVMTGLTTLREINKVTFVE